MSYDRMKEKERQIRAEVRELLAQAEAIDAEEDAQNGSGVTHHEGRRRLRARLQQQSGQWPEGLLADSGYCSEKNLEHLETAGESGHKIDAHIATGKQKHGAYRQPCPRGRLPQNTTRVERMKCKLQTKAGRAVYAARKTIVEPVFGQIKQARGFRQFLLRGLVKVRGEWALG